jgi:hypothetical protein
VFFTGFMLARGWLRSPGRRLGLILAAATVLVASVPLVSQAGAPGYGLWTRIPGFARLQANLAVFADKTHLGPLRFVHFLALAYLASLVAGEAGRRLRGPLSRIAQQTGRETLPVFLVSLVLAQALGVLLDVTGHGWAPTALANIGGCVVLIGAAYVVAWFKKEPWRRGRREDGLDAHLKAAAAQSQRIAA